MKIFIDSTLFIIYEWENGRRGDELLNYFGEYHALSFQSLIDKILTPSQQYKYIIGNTDLVYTISKKKEKIMFEEIEILKRPKN